MHFSAIIITLGIMLSICMLCGYYSRVGFVSFNAALILHAHAILMKMCIQLTQEIDFNVMQVWYVIIFLRMNMVIPVQCTNVKDVQDECI